MNIKTTSFEASGADIRLVRDIVFGEEQQVPRDIEWDGLDPACTHVMAYSDHGTPIGTGRITLNGKIGRLAILKAYRGKGLGAKLLERLIDIAKVQGLGEVYLHAQVQAKFFYAKKGFVALGDEFMEADIRHVKMVLDLTQ